MIGLHSSMEEEDVSEQVSCAYILVCKRKILSSILVLSVICVHFSVSVDHCVTWAYTSITL